MTSTANSVRSALGPVRKRLTDVTAEIRGWVENADNGQIDTKTGVDLLGKINRYLEKYNEYIAKLESVSVSPDEATRFQNDNEVFTNIMLDAEDVKVLLHNRLQDKAKVSVGEGTNRASSIDMGEMSAKLPKLIMPTFSGNRLKWFEFWERFYTAVDCKPNISKVDKFNLLKQQLSSDAAQAIAGLSLTSNNYDAAIDILKNRFANKALIIEDIYFKFRNLPQSNNTTSRLRSTLDQVENFCRSLEGLGENIENSNTFSLIKSKFPSEILLQLEEFKTLEESVLELLNSQNLVSQVDGTKKLRKQLDLLISNKEKIGNSMRNEGNYSKYDHSYYRKNNLSKEGNNSQSTTGMLLAGTLKCRFCTEDHWTDECPKFPTIDSRKEMLKGCCYKCLRKSKHTVQNCSVFKSCFYCKSKYHHRSLCPKKIGNKNVHIEKLSANKEDKGDAQLMAWAPLGSMQTATVEIYNNCNSSKAYGRVILDTGSHRSYIVEKLAKQLNLEPVHEEKLTISVFGTTKPVVIDSYTVEVNLKMTNGSFIRITANVVPFILRNKIEYNKHLEDAKSKFPNLNFADKPKLVNNSAEIQILLGNSYYYDIITLEKIELQRGLYMLSSKFGWIITGRSEEKDNSPCFVSMLTCLKQNNEIETYMEEDVVSDDCFKGKEMDLKHFWSLETLGDKERSCEEIEDDWALEQFEEKSKPTPIFVERRVDEIKENNELTSVRFVPGRKNIADIATRGCTVSELKNMPEWWYGPNWLEKEEEWPENQNFDDTSNFIEEIKDELEVNLVSAEINIKTPYEVDENKFCMLFRLLRATAYVRRAVIKFRRKLAQLRNITFNETINSENFITDSEMSIIIVEWEKYVQSKNYWEEINYLENRKSNLLIKQLGLYFDKNKVIRCRGRLAHADLSENEKFPVLLPGKEHFTKLVIYSVHKKLFHVGVSHTLCELRRQYWVPQGRSVVSKVLRKCVPCTKMECKAFNYPEPPALPEFRITRTESFTSVGIDYLGPLWVNTLEGKTKVWICLFTCLVVRAVHLEVVESLSAEDFLLCLRRFVARRGVSKLILSDNATHFKTVEKVLSTKIKTIDFEVRSYFVEKGIVWKWVPEFSPWMGGAYERLIGLTKRCLKKTLEQKLLTRVQLDTIVVEVESVLNSRPLVYVGPDAEEILTPAHLCQLRSVVSLEADNYKNEKHFNKTQDELLESWKKGAKLLDQFWEIWKKEYLFSLRERSKLRKKKRSLRDTPTIGEAVLIEDRLPRQRWKTGRIVALNSSRDGVVRSVVVKTKSRNLTRPINKLYPLEVDE